MKLFIACSAKDTIPDKYVEDCRVILKQLMKENDLIFGASNSGLMGLAYQIALENNRNVTGVCAEANKEELISMSCHTNIITNSITERTHKLISTCDAIIFLPGGIGTIYEMFASIDSRRCNEFNKPIIIYNSCGYYNKLLDFLEEIYEDGFLNDNDRDNYFVSDSMSSVLNYINNYKKKI